MSTTVTSTDRPPRNGVDVPRLFATLDAVKGQNEIAKFQFRASNTWVSGTHSRSQLSGFFGAMQEMEHKNVTVLDADHPAVLVGEDNAPTPIEFILHAIAACLTSGVANIAAARGIQLHKVTSAVEGDIDLLGILGLSDGTRPQWLPADPGHLPHRGRRRRRDAAPTRGAVPAALSRLRRLDQSHPGRHRRRHRLTTSRGQTYVPRSPSGRNSRTGSRQEPGCSAGTQVAWGSTRRTGGAARGQAYDLGAASKTRRAVPTSPARKTRS